MVIVHILLHVHCNCQLIQLVYTCACSVVDFALIVKWQRTEWPIGSIQHIKCPMYMLYVHVHVHVHVLLLVHVHVCV